MQTVAVVGLGYVGLPLDLLAAKKDYEVTGIDLNESKVTDINNGVDPLEDEYVSQHISKHPIKATTDFSATSEADTVIICVPTPVKDDYQPDLSPLKSSIEAIGPHLKQNALLIIESTINPGVCDEVVVPLLEKVSNLEIGTELHLSHCPERINPGDPYWTVENIPRVTGSYSQEGLEKTVEFYESIVDADIKPMDSLKEAEAVKVVENSFRDVNIAFVNELAMSFSALGINTVNVINGAATKPFAFMPHYPGVGVGGHCIPVDPYYLIEYARQSGFEHKFLQLARDLNNQMPKFAIQQLIQGLQEASIKLKDAKIAVLGLSYKPNVADDRESPAYKLISLLAELDIVTDTYDPYFKDKSTVVSLDQAITAKDAVFIATAHEEFKDLDPKKLKEAGVSVVVDGRNCLNVTQFKQHGLLYKGMGV